MWNKLKIRNAVFIETRCIYKKVDREMYEQNLDLKIKNSFEYIQKKYYLVVNVHIILS